MLCTNAKQTSTGKATDTESPTRKNQAESFAVIYDAKGCRRQVHVACLAVAWVSKDQKCVQ